MDYDWEDLSLALFLKENSNEILTGFYAFKGESNLIDRMLFTGNFSTGYGGGVDPLLSMNILDKTSFTKSLDFDSWRNSIKMIAFTSAVSPIASLALRKNIFRELNLIDLDEHDVFFNDSPSSCQGAYVISVIVLSIIWVAVARNHKRNKNLYIDEPGLFSVFVNGAITGKFLDFKEVQKAIKKSLDVIRHISFQELTLDEVKSSYSDFEKVVDEFDFLNAVLHLDKID